MNRTARIERLGGKACELARSLYQNGNVSSARAVLVEGGEEALIRFEELQRGKPFANELDEASFIELTMGAKAGIERTALSALSALGGRPKKSLGL